MTSTHSFAKFTITPGIGVRGEYNDNIFLGDSDKEYDFITTLTPDIRLEYSPNKSLDLSLDYGLDFRYYSRYSDLNEETQRVEMNASAKPFKRVFIDVTDTYARVPIDIRNKYALDNTLTNMTDSNSFSVSTRVVLPVTSTVSTTAGYNYSDLWFEDEGSTDSETHSAFFELTDRLSSKITGALKYNYSAYRPDLTGQQEAVVGYNRHNGSIAIEYLIASNFVVDVELGESWTDYATGYNSQRPFWNIGADYTFKFISGTSIGIDFSRSVIDSLTSGASRNRRGDLFFRTGNMLKLTVNPYFIDDTFLHTDRKDEIKGVNVDVSRPLGSKTILLLNGLLEEQRFMPEGEKVGRYSLGCSLDYKLSSKITAVIGYRHNGRDSNIANEDFTNNIGWLQARVSF
ncbi:TIGR03016 family PEP-CTERM system-associated outer membrane protein [Candidatus Pacearchaeota archaeon]|nr:TIGR03016 family PEP-CTERM system-associated outer membrane protein [Candidatus Pacearchaeota archaeon]